MTRITHLAAVVVLIGIIAGCNSTVKGIAEDTERNAEKASKGANESVESVSNAGAAILTPRLKTAITSNSELNDSRNSINVDTTEKTVTLSGHVYSAEMKAKAEAIVRAEMKEAEAKQSLKNELVIGS